MTCLHICFFWVWLAVGLVEGVFLGKSKRKRHRDRMRYLLWRLKRQERSRMLHESFWDKQACELVAVDHYFLHDVSPGEFCLTVAVLSRRVLGFFSLDKGWVTKVKSHIRPFTSTARKSSRHVLPSVLLTSVMSLLRR